MGGLVDYIKNTYIIPPRPSPIVADTRIVSGGGSDCSLTTLDVEAIEPATFKIDGTSLSYNGTTNYTLPINTTGVIYLYNNGGSGGIANNTTLPNDAILIATFITNATQIIAYNNVISGVSWGDIQGSISDQVDLYNQLFYSYVKSVPGASWGIVHNLGKYPNVRCVNGLGEEIFGNIQYINENSLTVTFSEPVSGTAYLY